MSGLEDILNDRFIVFEGDHIEKLAPLCVNLIKSKAKDTSKLDVVIELVKEQFEIIKRLRDTNIQQQEEYSDKSIKVKKLIEETKESLPVLREELKAARKRQERSGEYRAMMEEIDKFTTTELTTKDIESLEEDIKILKEELIDIEKETMYRRNDYHLLFHALFQLEQTMKRNRDISLVNDDNDNNNNNDDEDEDNISGRKRKRDEDETND